MSKWGDFLSNDKAAPLPIATAVNGENGSKFVEREPSNFRKPWWHAVDNGLLVANPLGESELAGRGKKRENILVKVDESFRLCYGALIHLDGKKEDFQPADAYQDFLKRLPWIGGDE